MSTTPITTIIIISLIIISISSATETITAYDILKSYNFPVGLIPKGVTGYEFNSQTGEFKLYLPKTCKFHIESYELQYKTTISGILTKDRLYKLTGVSVKILLLWLNIVEVRRDEDELQFSVGIASANFPLEGFEESPQCGCGFDCVTLNTRGIQIGVQPLVSVN